jgi:serine/threonine protein kinase
VESISTECRDLIKKMLEKKPEKRISVREILDHPWIANYKEEKINREWGYHDES